MKMRHIKQTDVTAYMRTTLSPAGLYEWVPGRRSELKPGQSVQVILGLLGY